MHPLISQPCPSLRSSAGLVKLLHVLVVLDFLGTITPISWSDKPSLISGRSIAFKVTAATEFGTLPWKPPTLGDLFLSTGMLYLLPGRGNVIGSESSAKTCISTASPSKTLKKKTNYQRSNITKPSKQNTHTHQPTKVESRCCHWAAWWRRSLAQRHSRRWPQNRQLNVPSRFASTSGRNAKGNGHGFWYMIIDHHRSS